MKRALFPGSFDPFTEGHDHLVRRALRLFDSVVVAVGVNSEKHYLFTADERVRAIKQRYANEPRVEVVQYGDMTIDCCHRENADYIVRGVRNEKDMLYEQTVAAVNYSIDKTIETVLLIADPAMVEVSSTAARERLLHPQIEAAE